MDILHEILVQLINKLLLIHQPTLCTLWICLRDLESLPMDEHTWTGVITCGGFKEAEECRVGGGGGGGSTLPFLPTVYLVVYPWSWRLGKQEIHQLSAPRRR